MATYTFYPQANADTGCGRIQYNQLTSTPWYSITWHTYTPTLRNASTVAATLWFKTVGFSRFQVSGISQGTNIADKNIDDYAFESHLFVCYLFVLLRIEVECRK